MSSACTTRHGSALKIVPPSVQNSQVRFKLASSYSGRVLKHVYEDGQELDSPEEKYPHSFVHHKMPPNHLEVEQLLGFEDGEQQGDRHFGPSPNETLIPDLNDFHRQLDGRSLRSLLPVAARSRQRVFVPSPGVYPQTGLIAQRINVYRGMESYKPAADQTAETGGESAVSSRAAC